jgi:hypothetical protein
MLSFTTTNTFKIMSVWEYKVITSGKGGFATPALMETFLNQLGKEEWEIVAFRAQPDNLLAFSGLARRSTQRDWTLEDAVAKAAKDEADKLRAEFEAKFKGSGSQGAVHEEKQEVQVSHNPEVDDGLRRVRDTEKDHDPEATEQEGEVDEWDKLQKEDELPTFFEALEPLMRRNQRGSGLSAGVDFLAKKWNISEDDVKGALKECGFSIPDDEDTKPAYVEYDGDLYWVNVNRRGEYWVNTKEKPRPVFRIVQGTAVQPEPEPAVAEVKHIEPIAAKKIAEPKPNHEVVKAEAEQHVESKKEHKNTAEQKPSGKKLPEGQALLDSVKPHMRRNRVGPGWGGSFQFLSRALRCKEADLLEAFNAFNLTPAQSVDTPPNEVELDGHFWWLSKDQRGGTWINAREGVKTTGTSEVAQAPEVVPVVEVKQPVAVKEQAPVLSALRLLLKVTKTGTFSAETGRLAQSLSKSKDELMDALLQAGLKLPAKVKDKPIFVEHAGEIFWINKNAKSEFWLNAKATKFKKPAAAPAKVKKPKAVKRSKA